MMKCRVFLADRSMLVCEGVGYLLSQRGYEVVGSASNGNVALCLISELKPNVAVVDIDLPTLNGIDLQRGITKSSLGTRVLILTAPELAQVPATLTRALKAGIRGCILKTQGVDALMEAIRDIASGKMHFSPAVSRTILEVLKLVAPLPDPLSPREQQVLQLVAEGKTTKEAAGILNIGTETAETHRSRLMKKLDIHETAGLVRYAVKNGLTTV